MIDGTQFTFHAPDNRTYLLALPCWDILVNESTGIRVNDVRTANLRGLEIKLKPSSKGGYLLLVNGSLHKYYNYGQHNADQFTFHKLRQSIDSFIDLFGVTPESCFVHGLEIGLNLPLPYSPLKVLKSVVCYRSKPFTLISKRNARKGLECGLNQYAVKLYDKAEQSGIDCGNVLRFEVHIDKMQVISRYNILSLSDLYDERKVFDLLNVLVDALQGIVWTDSNVNIKRLSDREQKQWFYYSNPKTWGQLSKQGRYKALKKWETLLHKYGNPPNLLPLIKHTWQELFASENEAGKGLLFYQVGFKSEAVEKATFLQLECTVKRSPVPTQNSTITDTSFGIKKNYNIRKRKLLCLTCGKDISNQKKGSRFCSEKVHGKAGKRCRNKHSNGCRKRKQKNK